MSQEVVQDVGKEGVVRDAEVKGLPVFVGEYLHSLDPKKRITIPSVWRTQIDSPKSVYVLPDFHRTCLNVYPAAEIIHKLESIRRFAMKDEKAMHFASVLGSSSELVSWDVQGRIRINDKLLAFAKLTDRVLLVAALNKFQLWNPDERPESTVINQDVLRQASEFVDF